MTSKPDYVSTLGYHWTDRTGRPLEPQVHWDATGTTLAEASTQWCSSGDPVLICIIGTHWKTTGATSTLGCHWNHTGWCLHPVVSQWRSSVNLHNWNTLEDHWKATGRPLEDHWKHTGISPVAFQCTLGSKFQAHWIATGLPLEDHWLRVRVGVPHLQLVFHQRLDTICLDAVGCGWPVQWSSLYLRWVGSVFALYQVNSCLCKEVTVPTPICFH